MQSTGPTEPETGSVGAERDVAGDAPDATHPSSFDSFPIDPDIREAIASMGYEVPTEVQSRVINDALAGRDIVVQSKTGSGKTTAFGIPLVQTLEAVAAEPRQPHALVLVPTRELATQVATEVSALSQNKGVRVHPVYGGVSIGKQVQALEKGVDIVVGTPGRLLDHIRRKNLDLSAVRMIVLDEADEMLSMGFWDDVTDLIKMCPAQRQAMLFSATLPYQVAKAAAEYLKNPVRIDLSGDDLTVAQIENHILHVVPDVPKPRQLLYLLEYAQPESAIVFCNTRNETEMIAKYLTQLGLVAEALTGNFRQKERERVMGQIKADDLRFMVATDIASRGIDISHLSHVINYSLPEFPEVYVHRVGRTGRAGNTGAAISLVDGKGLGTLSVLERQFNITFNELVLPPEEEMAMLRSKRIMKELSEKASVAEVGQHLPVAKEILESEDSGQIVAFLLKSYFAAEADDGRKRGRPAAPAANGANGANAASAAEPAAEGQDEEGGKGKRRRRRRRRRRGGDKDRSMDTLDAATALQGEKLPPPVVEPSADAAVAAADEQPALPSGPDADGMVQVRVNIGFDDGFKGKGAVAKKISALAGLNDGIVTEIESKRGYAVLKASPEVAEMLVDRVHGAQIGKKIVTVTQG